MVTTMINTFKCCGGERPNHKSGCRFNKSVAEVPVAVEPAKPTLADRLRPQSSVTAPHVEVQALAGTGKTITVVGGVMAAKGVDAGIVPSEQQRAVWEQIGASKCDSIRLSAFNNTITDELKKWVRDVGLDQRGVEARGIHSLGYSAVTKAFGRREPTNDAVREVVGKVMGGDWRDLIRKPGNSVAMQATADLVSLCKQTLTDPTPDGLDQLTSHYDVDVNGSRDLVYDLVPQVLERCKHPEGNTISFDDMIWLPLVHDLPIYKVDLQIVDESQDLNRMQQELVYRAGKRVVFVGDRHQAIYGFAGADARSMDRMRETLGERPEGVVTLPLTVTRRCGKAIVAEAQKIVQQFEAHPDNPTGSVRRARYPIQRGPSGDKSELPWEETYAAECRGGDRVICRVNAPLVSQCFRFLKKNIPATILGRNIGQGLLSLVDRSKTSQVPMLVGWLGEWLSREIDAENRKKFPSENKLLALTDKYDCLLCFCEGSSDVQEVRQKIDKLFTDNKSNPGVQLSSIHKSKGLEADRVFLLEPEGATVPHPMAKMAWEKEQEWNLRYVAITRARQELIYVS